MPRQLQIVDGPNFRSLAIMNGIVSESRWDMTFTMDQDAHPRCQAQHHNNPRKFQFPLSMLGSARKIEGEDVKSEDLFCFIGRYYGGYDLPKRDGDPRKHYGWFFLGRYNVSTRKGTCIELTDDEFRDSVEGQGVLMEFMKEMLQVS